MGIVSHDNAARLGLGAGPLAKAPWFHPPTGHRCGLWLQTKGSPLLSPDPCLHPIYPDTQIPWHSRSEQNCSGLPLSTPRLPPACVSVTDLAFIPYDPTPNFGD